MTYRIFIVVAALIVVNSQVSADIIAQGLELKPAQPAAELTLERLDGTPDDLVTVRVGTEGAQKIKGYGFVVSFDADRLEYVGSEETFDSLISQSGSEALMVHKNHEDERVAVGAVQVDGSSGSGKGSLVDVTFRVIGGGQLGEFRLTEGVLVDITGQTREVPQNVLENLQQTPADFGLNQNVPNPFNPETTISYQLPVSERVRLTVYTSLGQEVRTLVDGAQEAGAYTIRWDGRDGVGRQVASGVYFYRMQAGTFSDSRRMMLLK